MSEQSGRFGELVDDLVEFWHTEDFGKKLLDEAARDWLNERGLLAAPGDGASPSPGATGSNLELREALLGVLRNTNRELEQIYTDYQGHGPDPYEYEVEALLPIIATHVAEEKRKLREEIAAELASVPGECYPEDVFGRGLSTDDTRNISEALAPIGITLDRISAAVMRHAYKNAARIARGEADA